MNYPNPENSFQALAGIKLLINYKITLSDKEKELINKCLRILEEDYFKSQNIKTKEM